MRINRDDDVVNTREVLAGGFTQRELYQYLDGLCQRPRISNKTLTSVSNRSSNRQISEVKSFNRRAGDERAGWGHVIFFRSGQHFSGTTQAGLEFAGDGL